MLKEATSMASYNFSLQWIILPFVTETRKQTDLWGTVAEKYQKSKRECFFGGVKFLQESYALSWLQHAQLGGLWWYVFSVPPHSILLVLLVLATLPHPTTPR